MAARRYSVAALAAGLALVLAGCGGSGEPRPDLVLVSTRDGDYAIYALDADGGSQKRLTEGDVDASSPRGLLFQIDPAWSPDGRSIAFASKRSGTFDIYVMNADGTGTRRVTSGPEDDGHPTWSPDGGRIAFDRGASGDLYVMSSDGSGVQPIADDPAPENEPAWSPDGRWIAYVRRTPGTEVRELWLVRADGSEQQRLTSLRASSLSPTWSPDGTRIAFASNAVETLYDIFTLTLGKKDARRLTLTGPDAFEPAWSPDGSTIAFSRGGSIFTVDLEGNVEDVTDPDNNDSSPAWNPRLPSATES